MDKEQALIRLYKIRDKVAVDYIPMVNSVIKYTEAARIIGANKHRASLEFEMDFYPVQKIFNGDYVSYDKRLWVAQIIKSEVDFLDWHIIAEVKLYEVLPEEATDLETVKFID